MKELELIGLIESKTKTGETLPYINALPEDYIVWKEKDKNA
jgi:hypothetical protein